MSEAGKYDRCLEPYDVLSKKARLHVILRLTQDREYPSGWPGVKRPNSVSPYTAKSGYKKVNWDNTVYNILQHSVPNLDLKLSNWLK